MNGKKAKKLRRIANKIAKVEEQSKGFFSKLFTIVREKAIPSSDGVTDVIKQKETHIWQGYRRIYQNLKKSMK